MPDSSKATDYPSPNLLMFGLAADRRAIGRLCFVQSYASASRIKRTFDLIAAQAIVDATPIALVKPKFGTKMPDCLLNEARKDPWELPIEYPGINSQGDLLDNGRTTFRPTASDTVCVLRMEPRKNSGTVQPVVNQRVDCDHSGSGFEPQCPARIASQEKVGQAHVQNLVRDTVHVAQR